MTGTAVRYNIRLRSKILEVENLVEKQAKTGTKVEEFRGLEGYMKLCGMERMALEGAISAAEELPEPYRETMLEALDAIGKVSLRLAQKRKSDARYEARRRRLVGAQMPVELADKVRKLAKIEGVSMYALVIDLVERECRRLEFLLEAGPPGVTDCPAAGEGEVNQTP